MLFDRIRRKFDTGHFWKYKRKKERDDTGRLRSLPYHSELGGHVPVDYDIEKHLEYIMHKIDKETDSLLKNAAVDKYNRGTFLDKYIEARFNLVRNDLKRQKIRHEHIINGLCIIKTAQLTKIDNMKENLKEAVKQCEEDLSDENNEEEEL